MSNSYYITQFFGKMVGDHPGVWEPFTNGNNIFNGLLTLDSDKNEIRGYNIFSLGIQTLPGVKFRINDGNEVYVGQTGIFELTLPENTPIKSITFTNLPDIFKNAPVNTVYLLIDLIYAEDEAQEG